MADKKYEDDYDYIPFVGLDKGAVIQERRLFNETTLNTKKCCYLLTKILYVLGTGDTFSRQEATTLFFSITKLFQSNDPVLRRMMYLGLKELVPLSDDVIIITSSLTNDMNNGTDVNRANAVRVLRRVITELALLGQGERYLKQAIVDREPYVATASLVSGYHLFKNPANIDIVKRWFNEIQEATKSKSEMVQYHALGLLYKTRQHDKLAVSKIVNSVVKANIRSPFAHCLLIRLTREVLVDDPTNKTLLEYLDGRLKHKSSLIILEAAQALCSLPDISPKALIPAISQLHAMLSANRTVKRFAAIRCLNKIAMNHPLAVSTCNNDIETLISGNRSIATLAITTLLKTGNESGVERLMKQIQGFMSEISDDFKINVVEAIQTLCIKFPKKQHVFLSFLSSSLRNEGGLPFKTAIVDALFEIMRQVPESKDIALAHLCEFIEDCEFVTLCCRILYHLGEEGPTSESPAKHIRYIYNRVLLEPAIVRASAVSALAKFGRRVESLRPRIITILKRCLVDLEEEVRDKAAFHLNLLQTDPKLSLALLESTFPVPLENLEASLNDYLKNPSGSAFDLKTVSLVPPKDARHRGPSSAGGSSSSSSSSSSSDSKSAAGGAAKSGASANDVLAQVPELAGLGKVFRSSKPVELTESETEYTVNCVKHIFPQHIVLQFNCSNTLSDQQLEDVFVKIESDNDEFSIEQEIPCKTLPYGTNGLAFVVLAIPDGSFPSGSFTCNLKFNVKDVDQSGEVSDSSYEDEYQLENLEIATSDYMAKVTVPDFQKAWDASSEDTQAVETYNLSSIKSLEDGVREIVNYLGMSPCDGSEVPKKTRHVLYLSGIFVGNVKVLVRVRMKLDANGVSIEVTARSSSELVNQTVANAIQ